MKKHEKTKNTAYLRGFAVMFSFLILFAGCTSSDNPFSSESTESSISIDDLNINVKYAESYDQTTITFSRHWPEGITAGFGKMISPNNGEMMIDYENVNKTISYDHEGYISTIIEFIDGDETMNMPEYYYDSIKDEIPSRSSNYDPIVKEIMTNGVRRVYGQSGSLKFEKTYDLEDFRLTANELDSIDIWFDILGTSNAINSNIDRMNLEGINFQIEDNYYVRYSKSITNRENQEVSFEYLDDLRTGLNIQTIAYDYLGRATSITLNTYSRVDGLPILNNQSLYQFGDLNDKWQIVYRTVMTRENIQILKN